MIRGLLIFWHGAGYRFGRGTLQAAVTKASPYFYKARQPSTVS
jgi:hypothetical protein